ncbi:MAG TPA: cytochrome c [Microthrixaceae bacterium]|nr:cytochrome c [Microthrixaceae bacterium]
MSNLYSANRTRRSLPLLLPVVLAGFLALAGCSGEDSGSTAEPTLDGATLYAQNCASCHGADLRGTDKGPSHLSQVYEPGHHPDDSFRAAIEQGVTAHHWGFGDMEPVAGLDSAEADAIIAYIRERQRAEGFEPYPPS